MKEYTWNIPEIYRFPIYDRYIPGIFHIYDTIQIPDGIRPGRTSTRVTVARTDTLALAIHGKYITSCQTMSVHTQSIPVSTYTIHTQLEYIVKLETSQIHWKYYIENTSIYLLKLAGTFHCPLGPVWPPTAAQCLRPGAFGITGYMPGS
jgi:hypothetical protein